MFYSLPLLGLLNLLVLVRGAHGSPLQTTILSDSNKDLDALNPYPHKPRLTFRPDGTFKLTVFSDLHYGENPWDWWGPEQDKNSTRLMRRVLKEEKPDFVVLNGDLITGENTFKENSTSLIDEIVRPLNEVRVPFASSYGNHDNQINITHLQEITREQQVAPLSYTRRSPPGVGGIGGEGNYWVPIYHKPTDFAPSLILWFFDSRGGVNASSSPSNPQQLPDWVDASVADWIKEETRKMDEVWGPAVVSGTGVGDVEKRDVEKREELWDPPVTKGKREELWEPPSGNDKREELWGAPTITNDRREKLWGPPTSNDKREELWGPPTITNGEGEELWGPPASDDQREELWGAPTITNDKRKESWGAPTITNDKREKLWGAPTITNDKRKESWGAPTITNDRKRRDLSNNVENRQKGRGKGRGSLAFVHIPPHVVTGLQEELDGDKEPGLNADLLQGSGSVQGTFEDGHVGSDDEFWKALNEKIGNLHAVISGHDHGNEWCIRDNSRKQGKGKKGVIFCFDKHSGYGGYSSDGWGYGVRNLVFKSPDPSVGVETWIRLEGGETRARVVLDEAYN